MVAEGIKDIIQRAIKMEETSYALYTSAIGRVKDPSARTGLTDLAAQEKMHKTKLEALLAGNLDWAIKLGKNQAVKDLQIGQYLEAKPINEKSSLQDVLIVAMKREENAHNFYTQMGALVDAGPAKDLFGLLAKEEVKHKKYLESIYEEVVYKEF